MKRAIVMHHRKCDVFTADNLLKQAEGRLHKLLAIERASHA